MIPNFKAQIKDVETRLCQNFTYLSLMIFKKYARKVWVHSFYTPCNFLSSELTSFFYEKKTTMPSWWASRVLQRPHWVCCSLRFWPGIWSLQLWPDFWFLQFWPGFCTLRWFLLVPRMCWEFFLESNITPSYTVSGHTFLRLYLSWFLTSFVSYFMSFLTSMGRYLCPRITRSKPYRDRIECAWFLHNFHVECT